MVVKLIHLLFCMVCTLGPLVCSKSELTSETMNPFKHFGRTPWMGHQFITRPLPTEDSTTWKNANIHPCLKQDLNSWSLLFKHSKTTRLRSWSHWDWQL